MTTTLTRAPAAERALGATAWAISGVGLLKFASLLIEHGAAHAPWGLLFVFVLPFAVGAVMLRFRRRTGAALIGIFAAAVAVVCTVAVVQGIDPGWANWLLVLVAGPLSLIAVGLTVRLLRGR